jgi:hypothetical protein
VPTPRTSLNSTITFSGSGSVVVRCSYLCTRARLSNPEPKFIVKFCFQQLPVGIRLQQRSSHVPASCPVCNEAQEDDWHWIACPARAPWRATQATLFSSRLISLKTEPGLKSIALQAFKSLLATGSCDFTGATFSPCESQLVHSQSTIGWKHFLYGRCSVEWASLQDRYTISEKLDPKYYNGASWTSKVITHMWRSMRDLWLVRNTDLHGTTFSEGEATQRARLTPLIRSFYDRIDDLAPHDRAMLSMPLTDRLKQPLSVLLRHSLYPLRHFRPRRGTSTCRYYGSRRYPKSIRRLILVT